MYVIDLRYVVALEELDRHMTEHVKFLKHYYAKNVFVASGRKVPRTGGIILALCRSVQEADAIMREDPFFIHGCAEFTVTEFLTSQVHPDFKSFLQKYAVKS